MAVDHDELLQARIEIERLKAKTSTTLTGTEFLTLIFVLPIILSFVCLGIIIVWKATSNPMARKSMQRLRERTDRLGCSG